MFDAAAEALCWYLVGGICVGCRPCVEEATDTPFIAFAAGGVGNPLVNHLSAGMVLSCLACDGFGV